MDLNWEKEYAFDTDPNYAYGYKNTLAYNDAKTPTNDTTTTNTYNKNNQMFEQLVRNYQNYVTNENEISYDSAGNRTLFDPTSGTSITYTYDAFERLSSSTPYGGTATTYQYDAISQRVTKTTGSTTNTSIWNDGKIAADYKTVSGNTTLNSYIMGNEGEIINGVLYSNLVTGQGDVLKSINYNTKDETSYDYDAYGNKFCDDTPISPLNYRGQYFDSESGLYYLKARYYDPNTQQFMQEDTYQNDNIEMNLYGYCSANPVLRSDPSGHILKVVSKDKNKQKSELAYYQSLTDDTLVISNGEIKIAKYGHSKAKKNGNDAIYYWVTSKNVFKANIRNIYISRSLLQSIGYSYSALTNIFMDGLNYTISKYVISNCTNKSKIKKRIANFIAQISVESGFGQWNVELGDKAYFNKAYGPAGKINSKMGDVVNINTGLRRYCGGGYLQLSTRANYKAFAKDMKNPKILSQGVYYVAKYYAWQSAGWWWKENDMNSYIDSGHTIKQVSYKVNHGYNGLDKRISVYNNIMEYLN